MLEKCYLTPNGNILRETGIGDFFQTAAGEFIREVLPSETAHLKGKLTAIYVDSHDLLSIPHEFPRWKFLGRFTVCIDHTQFDPLLSSNGGRYAYITYRDYFYAYVNRQWSLRFVEFTRTSAEFDFDELAGVFQTGVKPVPVMNCDIELYYDTSSSSDSVVLEQISTEVEFFTDLWQLNLEYLTADTKETQSALKISDKKKIINILHDLDLYKSKRSRSRSHRR